MRSRLLAIPFGLAVVVVMATAVMAGGWAQVTVSDPPVHPIAGGGTTIGVDVLQHGVTPVSWPRLTVVATNATTGAVVQTEARADSTVAGHYTATLAIPVEGTWNVSFVSQDLDMVGTSTLAVGPPAVSAPGAPSAGTAVDPVVGIALAIASLIAIALVVAGVRARRGDTRVATS